MKLVENIGRFPRVAHQEALRRDINYYAYPLSSKRAARPTRPFIFSSSPETEFFNRIDPEATLSVAEKQTFNAAVQGPHQRSEAQRRWQAVPWNCGLESGFNLA